MSLKFWISGWFALLVVILVLRLATADGQPEPAPNAIQLLRPACVHRVVV